MPVKQRWGIWQRKSVTKCWSYNHNKRKVNKTVLTCFTIKTISFESNILYHAVTSKIDRTTALQIRFLLLILWIYIWKTDEYLRTSGYNKINWNGKVVFFSGQSILLGINDNDIKHMLTSWTEKIYFLSFVRKIDWSAVVPITKERNAGFWCFLYNQPEPQQAVDKTVKLSVIWDSMSLVWLCCNERLSNTVVLTITKGFW